MKAYGDLFTGFGGTTIGAMAAGLTPLWGVEYRPDVAEIANGNLGNHVRVADILECDPMDFERVNVLHASPPCPNFSVAKAGATETPHDLDLAHKVAEFVEVLQPDVFTLENVYGYRKSQSWAIIRETLHECGYWLHLDHCNSADYGVPQTRKRMIVRAVRGGWVPYLPQPVEWVGWYAAIEDLLDTLPESQFAPWQEKRLESLFSRLVCEPNSWYNYMKKGANYGKNEEEIATKVLRVLRQRIGAKALCEWGARILAGYEPAKILQSNLYGKIIRTNTPAHDAEQRQYALLFAQICKRWGLRDLWCEECFGCSSCEWELDGQFTREFAAYLSYLSYEDSQSASIMLGGRMSGTTQSERVLQQTLSSFQEVWRSTVLENQNGEPQEKSGDYSGRFGCQSSNQKMENSIEPDFSQPEKQTEQDESALTVSKQGLGRARAWLINGENSRSDGSPTILNQAQPASTIRSGRSNPPKAFLVDGASNANSYGDNVRGVCSPAYTAKANQNGRMRAYLEHGRVVAMTPRALARFQSFPDWYELPEKRLLAAYGIGNAVPCLMYQRIVEGLI